MSVQSRTVRTGSPAETRRSIFWLGRKQGERLGKTIAFLLMVFLGFFYAFPFYWTLNTALKTDQQVFQWPPTIYPPTPQWIKL